MVREWVGVLIQKECRVLQSVGPHFWVGVRTGTGKGL